MEEPGKRGGEILVTSSHRPSRRVRSFVNDLAKTLPGATRINRGKKSLEDLKDLMRLTGYKVLIVVNTWKANPGRVDIYVREEDILKKVGSIYISSIKLSREQFVPNCFFRSPQIDSRKCGADICGVLIDIFSTILGVRHNSDRSHDEKIHIEVSNKNIYIWFSKGGRICGPRIGIREAYREKEI
ncbi:MAG TPA: hypothetical protein VNL13_06235 [Sulfolobales archaeon]|nr:hypothetical protein [Sulfolobales archaeon]